MTLDIGMQAHRDQRPHPAAQNEGSFFEGEKMASFITTMSVPVTPAPAYISYRPESPAQSASRSPSLILSPSGLYQTTRTHHVSPIEPPSYLSPAVRALKQGSYGLTPPSNARTRAPFKPRSAAKGTSSYQLRQFAEATLGSGSLRKAVKLPEGEDLNEWLAVNGTTTLSPLFTTRLRR